MGKKLFVSNLDFEVDSETLKGLFAESGSVVSAVIASDKETKRSKGFAFIEMESDEVAQAAVQALNGKVINGRPIKVVEDRGKTAGLGGDSEGGRRPEPLPPIQRLQLFKRRKKMDPFMDDPNRSVDYKDSIMLSRFLSERGKILSRRLTGLTSFNQRKVSKAIKKAQKLGLLGEANLRG